MRLEIYNTLGKKIITLIDDKSAVGYKTVLWDRKDRFGKDVASGVYVYRIRAGYFTHVKKMVMLKYLNSITHVRRSNFKIGGLFIYSHKGFP